MHVEPYLAFEGRCEEAIELYRRAVGAEVIQLMRFKDSPTPAPGMTPPGSENKILHASLRIGDSVIMASDGECMGAPKFQGIALSLSTKDEAEAEQRFAALADGGTVTMPLAKTFFSSRFGMLQDRFGVSWIVLVAP